jgi:hypothetical protein
MSQTLWVRPLGYDQAVQAGAVVRPGLEFPEFRVLSREEVTHIYSNAGRWERKEFAQLTVEQIKGFQLVSPYAECLFQGRRSLRLCRTAVNDQ